MPKSVHTRAYTILRERLVSARTSRGLSQQQLADLLKRPQSYVAKVEGGERRIDIVELLEIVQVLKADIRPILRAVAAAL